MLASYLRSEMASRDPPRTPTVASVLFGLRQVDGIWALAAMPPQDQLGPAIKTSIVELIRNVLKKRKQETVEALSPMGATLVRAAEWVIESTDW